MSFEPTLFNLSVLIFLLVIGPAVGNYACSVIYRLPRGQTPFDRHPFCASCNADLNPIDLFPVLSWLLTRGKCRYCAAPIPALYTLVELACGVLFIVYFLKFNMSESFLLYSIYGTMVVILAAIHWQQGWIASSIYGYALTAVALARTLAEGSIYGFVQTGFVMLVLVLALYRVAGNKASPFTKPWIWWFTLMGALLPFALWQYIVPIFVVKLLTPKPARVLVYAAGALTLPLILP